MALNTIRAVHDRGTLPRHYSAVLFVSFPAIAMLLGWGLRGYIGGGPYGALIPGTFVTLAICLLLGFKMETAAVAALFGAIGIGYGGNMTYGQTLGFVARSEYVVLGRPWVSRQRDCLGIVGWGGVGTWPRSNALQSKDSHPGHPGYYPRIFPRTSSD